MSFTDAEEQKLIKLVSEHPVLYDAGDDDYHNHVLKENVWNTIGTALHKSGEECRRKWKFIRNGYSRFKKKCKLDPNSTLVKSRSKRNKLLFFLDDNQTVPPTEPEVEIENNVDTSQDDFEAQYEYVEEKNFTFVNADSAQSNEVKSEPEDICEQSPKRQKTYDSDRLQTDHTTIVRKREDDVDLFCRHIAEVLRNLPPIYKAKAKKHISAVVSDYEIKAAQSLTNTSEVSLEPDDDI